MGVPSRVALTHFISPQGITKLEANACIIYMTYHTAGLGCGDTDGVSTRLGPVQDLNTREIAFFMRTKACAVTGIK